MGKSYALSVAGIFAVIAIINFLLKNNFVAIMCIPYAVIAIILKIKERSKSVHQTVED